MPVRMAAGSAGDALAEVCPRMGFGMIVADGRTRIRVRFTENPQCKDCFFGFFSQNGGVTNSISSPPAGPKGIIQ